MSAPFRRVRRGFAAVVWAALVRFASRRRLAACADSASRTEPRSQTRGMGLRMSEPLRDRLRSRWLRVAGPNSTAPDAEDEEQPRGAGVSS